jgi:pyruvate/2-oxoglutarate dehydrogenase complex dihydrolipoamide dehydrogenase (E3) component
MPQAGRLDTLVLGSGQGGELLARHGFMKAPVGADDERILGFTTPGAEAGEVIVAVQTAMRAELPYPKLRDVILRTPRWRRDWAPSSRTCRLSSSAGRR